MTNVKRDTECSTGIFGTLASDDGELNLYTLEHAFLQPDGSYAPIIPPGTYTAVRRLSPKFGYDVFMIIGVIGHTFLEIHCGNWNSNSEGCVLLGMARQGNADILDSEIAFNKFMTKNEGLDSIQITFA
jgi:hypothetical protein